MLPRVGSLTSVFESPRITTSDKTALVNKTFSGRVSTITLNTLLVLANHERLGLLPELVNSLRRELDQRAGRREAVLTTANQITPDEQAAILKSVEESLGESLTAHFSVNPDLLGGLVVRIEDWQALRVESRPRPRLRRPRLIRRVEVVREPAPAARRLRAARKVQERDRALAVLLAAGLF